MRLLSLLLALATFHVNIMAAGTGEADGAQQIQNVPEGQGVFCRIEGSRWTKLAPATIADTKTEGMKRFLETDGLATIYTTITYAGTKASLRISDVRPVFFVRGVGSAQDALIVRLTQKKGSRETYSSSDNTSYHNKCGYKASDICRLLISPHSQNAFSGIPEEALKPGEYLITFGNVNIGYDFAVIVQVE
jgi:hypothetical protein